MFRVQGVLFAFCTFIVASSALICYTCLDDECKESSDLLSILCSRTRVQDSHGNISSRYGLDSRVPPIILSYECVELDSKLSYVGNNTDKYFSYKGCVEKGYNATKVVANATVISNDERNYFETCGGELCNKKLISRPQITPPSTLVTSNVTGSTVTTKSPVTTPIVTKVPPTTLKPLPPPPALKCYTCTNQECSVDPMINSACTKTHVDTSHSLLSNHFNKKSELSTQIESFECMTILSEITVGQTKNKLLFKGCVEKGYDPCSMKYEGNDSEKRDHCRTCTSDLCNSGSMMGSGIGFLMVLLVSLKLVS